MADWAVAVEGSIAADVAVGERQAHARVARHAVEAVDAEAAAAAADIAEGAVVDLLACTVIHMYSLRAGWNNTRWTLLTAGNVRMRRSQMIPTLHRIHYSAAD